MKFTFQTAFGLGYHTFKTRYGALLAACVVYVLIVAGGNVLLDHIAVPGLGFIAVFLFEGPLWAGLYLLAVRHIRGESPALKTLFAGFSGRYWPLVGISVVFALITVLPYALSMPGVAWSEINSGGPLLVFGLLGFGLVLIFARLGFAPILCIDPHRQLGIKESFTASWKITGPIFWPLLGLFFACMLIWTASFALFILPFIFVGFPLSLAIMAAAYQLCTGEENSNRIKEETVTPM